MQTVDKKMLSRIYGRGRGWAFTKTDFVAEFGEANIHKVFSTLAALGTIRRVCHGVYDYPSYSDLLGQVLSPDMDQVAQALARKFHWRIQPTGDTALNLIGISTQVPGKWLYLSDGPSRQYLVGQQTLAFRKSVLKDTGFKLRESGLLVQAIKALRKENIDESTLRSLGQWLDPALKRRILQDTRMVTSWVFEAIKRVCGEGV